MSFPGRGIDTGQEATIGVGFDTATGKSGAQFDYTLDRSDPAPVAVVRTATASATGTVFTVRLGETHRFLVSARERGVSCPFGNGGVQITVPVRPAVSLAARRNAARDYTFTGRVQPAYGTVDLYRIEADGRRVLTSRAGVQRDGTTASTGASPAPGAPASSRSPRPARPGDTRAQ